MRHTPHADCMTLTTRCLSYITPSSSKCPASVDTEHGAKFPHNSASMDLSGHNDLCINGAVPTARLSRRITKEEVHERASPAILGGIRSRGSGGWAGAAVGRHCFHDLRHHAIFGNHRRQGCPPGAPPAVWGVVGAG